MLIRNMLVPYVDVTLFPTFDISSAPVNTFLLGFIVADQDNDPSWGGYYKLNQNFYMDKINKVRSNGGDVIVSFGGANGKELAQASTSVESLFLKYKSVVDKFQLKSIDLDIEGPALYDQASCERRGAAILNLRNVYPKLQVSLTLPVMPYGLGKEALECMRVTPHDIVNIMAMNFGTEKDMAAAVISAIQATRLQTKKKIAVTVMIGQNDTPEVFTLKNALVLKTFLKNNPWVVRVSFWSMERDLGKAGVLSHSSQIRQKKFEFSNILK
jgi:hypothetical protein